MRSKNIQDLGVRTLINSLSAVLIAVLIFLAHSIFLSWIFVAAVAAVGAIAVWEYIRLVKRKGYSPSVFLSMTAVIFYIGSLFVQSFFLQDPLSSPLARFWHLAPVLILGCALFCCFILFITLSPILNVATTFFGIVYIGIPLGCFVQIMYFPFFQEGSYLEGSWWIIYLLTVTKSADIGGYFIGSYFGQRKLALKISPKKTLEGAIGGLIFSTLISLFICFLGKKIGSVFDHFSWLQALLMGIFLGIMSQVGDLAESCLKRDAGVKDSNTLPGVGGILDMIDSLLFTSPVVYLFLRILYTYTG